MQGQIDMTTQRPISGFLPEKLSLPDNSVSLPPKRSNKGWCFLFSGVAIGVFCLCALLLGTWMFLIQRGIGEVNKMGPWPDPEVHPEELVKVDLSPFGLEAGQIKNARSEETWSNGQYDDGVLIEFKSDAKTVVTIWALSYADAVTAGDDYNLVRANAEGGSCGAYATAYLGFSGMIHCQFSDGYTKIFWKDSWIVDITVLEGTDMPPAILVDRVRDALAAHWKTILEREAMGYQRGRIV